MTVVGIWTGRHANALLKALRLTNEAFAKRLGTAVRTVAKWNAQPDIEPTPEMQAALDTLLASTSDEVKARFTLILSGDIVAPSPNNGRVADLSDIQTFLADLTSSSTGNEVISQLDQATHALAEVHTQAPAKRLLGQALEMHKQVQKLLQGRLRLSQRRDLFRIESDLLAHACILLGDLKHDQAAEDYGRAALALAQEAESNQAVARTALAKTLRWRERFIESANMARQGFESCPPSTVRTQLASQEANAAALLGDTGRACEALRRAEKAAEVAQADSGVSAWSFPTARQAIFALSVATHTGDPDAALRAARMADAGWAAGEPQVAANWAQIRVGAGIAHLERDELDDTLREVTPVLSLAPDLRVATVTGYMENLDRRLKHPRFNASKVAVDLRHKLRDFNAIALREDQSTESGT